MDSAASLISFSSEHSTSIWLAKKPNYERESEEQEYFDRCSTELMMDADTNRDGLDNRATLSKHHSRDDCLYSAGTNINW